MTFVTAKTLDEVSSPKLQWLKGAAPRTLNVWGQGLVPSTSKNTSQVGSPPALAGVMLRGEGFAETQEILADPALMAAIRRGLRDAEEGRLFTTDEVRATLDV